jgi:hypothetical protein
MKDNPALNCIFEKRAELVQIFNFGSFEFTLLEAVACKDVCLYRVKRGLLEFEIAFSASIQRFPAGPLRKSISFISFGNSYDNSVFISMS